jgi:hypothetical protein
MEFEDIVRRCHFDDATRIEKLRMTLNRTLKDKATGMISVTASYDEQVEKFRQIDESLCAAAREAGHAHYLRVEHQDSSSKFKGKRDITTSRLDNRAGFRPRQSDKQRGSSATVGHEGRSDAESTEVLRKRQRIVGACYNCDQVGHRAADCLKPKKKVEEKSVVTKKD